MKQRCLTCIHKTNKTNMNMDAESIYCGLKEDWFDYNSRCSKFELYEKQTTLEEDKEECVTCHHFGFEWNRKLNTFCKMNGKGVLPNDKCNGWKKMVII